MMTFIKIILCDIRNGILSEWRKLIGVFLLFSVLTIFAFLDFLSASKMPSNPVAFPVSIGDYFCYIFGGTSAQTNVFHLFNNDLINGVLLFDFPSIWITVFLTLLLFTVRYPYNDLMGFGKHLMILSEKKHYWWLSKVIWCIVCVVTYFFIAILSIIIFAMSFGAKFSLEIGSYFPYMRIGDYDHILNPPWNITPTVALLIPVGIGICIIQLLLSLLTSPLTSFLCTSALLLVGTFVQADFLFPNAAMAARSLGFVDNGVSIPATLTIILWVVILCILIGYIYLRHIDIINHEK